MMKEPQGTYESTIPGGPGQDYPVFAFAPPTSFSCAGLTPGYYADLESDCQAYQRCTETNDAPIATLLCPNGTLYNQQYFVCDWWFNVDCSVVSSLAGIVKIRRMLCLGTKFNLLVTKLILCHYSNWKPYLLFQVS